MKESENSCFLLHHLETDEGVVDFYIRLLQNNNSEGLTALWLHSYLHLADTIILLSKWISVCA